jgi:hypothetical protein
MTTNSDDFDRDADGDLEQPALSQAEKEQILRDARATVARFDDAPPLDEWFSDDERRSILHRAHTLLVGHETPEIVDDDRAWNEDEKARIIADARDAVRRDAATGMITKVKMQDPFEAEEPEEARQPRQRYQRRRRLEAGADDVAHRAYRDPIKGTAWPAPREGNLDITLEGLIGARVESAFAEQHDYVCELMAQVLANSVERDGNVAQAIADAIEKERRQHRREVRELKARIGTLERSLEELRDAVALEKSRALALPVLPARRDFN